jgi:hypothetical protein
MVDKERHQDETAADLAITAAEAVLRARHVVMLVEELFDT